MNFRNYIKKVVVDVVVVCGVGWVGGGVWVCVCVGGWVGCVGWGVGGWVGVGCGCVCVFLF